MKTFISFLNKLYFSFLEDFFTDRERKGTREGGERESPADSPLTGGRIPASRDHKLSRSRESDAEPAEPSRAPALVCSDCDCKEFNGATISPSKQRVTQKASSPEL